MLRTIFKMAMTKRAGSALIGLILLSAALVPSAQAAEAVVGNGGFETPPHTGGFVTLGAGNTSLDPWLVGGAGVDHIGHHWVAAEGTHSLDLNAVDAGSITQNVDTVDGETYTLTFAMAGNMGAGAVVKTMDVYWDGRLAESFTFDVTGHSQSDMGWKQETLRLTASGSSTQLEFRSTTSGAGGPALDDISLGGEAPAEDPCETDPDAICGDEEDNEIQGTPEDETIYAGDGDDTIDGGGGNDVIVGGEGEDTLVGGTGEDTLEGGAGDDILVGDVESADGTVVSRASFAYGPLQEDTEEGSDDTLIGGDGNDSLSGGAGGDDLDGGVGLDDIEAGSGDDAVAAGDQKDTVNGGSGNDKVLGEGGNDDLKGAAGNDVLNGGAAPAGNDMNGGPGKDTCIRGTKKDDTKQCERTPLKPPPPPDKARGGIR